jgi:hypothetical protein
MQRIDARVRFVQLDGDIERIGPFQGHVPTPARFNMTILAQNRKDATQRQQKNRVSAQTEIQSVLYCRAHAPARAGMTTAFLPGPGFTLRLCASPSQS